MHGAGNDFMLLDLRLDAQPAQPPIIDADQVRAWGDRHRGVGFDQLLVLGDDARPEIDAKLTIWNADGSAAEQCGNGLRAIGLYLAERDLGQRQRFTVQGPIDAAVLVRESDDAISVAMGKPIWSAPDIPLAGLEPDAEGGVSLSVDGQTLYLGALSMGNPHAVMEVEDVDRAPLETVGHVLRNHPSFPASCNVGFAQVLDEGDIRLRVLERGAGETLACGSGACAAVAWLTRRGRVRGRVRVRQGGGTLWVETDRGIGPVTLTGPAAHVFEGTLE